jgi:hypothetical protein
MTIRKYVLDIQKSGFFAALIFLLVVVAGFITRKGFNAIDQVISTLYESGSRNGHYFQMGFITYNIFLAIFGLSIYFSAKYSSKRIIIGKLGGIIMIFCACAGAIDDLTPQDRVGATLSTIGKLHWLSTGIAFLLMVGSIILVTSWLSRNTTNSSFIKYSRLTVVLIITSGLLGIVAIPMRLPYIGLYETIVMFVFLFWIVILSNKMSGFINNTITTKKNND